MPDASSIEARMTLWARLGACWRFKVLLTLALNLFFWVGYGFLASHALFPVQTVPSTWVDRAIPFQPAGWSVVYLSEFLFTTTVPWLLSTSADLRRYAWGLFGLSGISFLFFLFLPVASPRPSGFIGDELHQVILQLDGAYNAFPSLHAGFLAYTFALAWRIFHHELPRWLWGLSWTWGTLVMYSTLAIRQHYFLDLIAGAAIGVAADAFAWRSSSSGDKAARMRLRRNALTSHAGSK
jgi:membrane-associated phospholipid phosphatase